MTPVNPSNAVTSLLWVEVTAPNVAKHWVRTSHILEGVNQQERDDTLARLKAGQWVDDQATGIRLHCPPMTVTDQNRLVHLADFEECGFRLIMFRTDAALFRKNQQDYYGMREMSERGFLPMPAIAVDQLNAPITTLNGGLIDVFVPVSRAPLNFYCP